jgi:hypothetical protein
MLETVDWSTNAAGGEFGRHGALPRYSANRCESASAIGLDRTLGPHCLRHSYATHLFEDGFDHLFVQQTTGGGPLSVAVSSGLPPERYAVSPFTRRSSHGSCDLPASNGGDGQDG